MWTYFNASFSFAASDYSLQELEPWKENGEAFRRLRVTFPGGIATRSTVQTFYIDKKGVMKRHDYSVNISRVSTGAKYLSDYVQVQSIKIATKRKV